MTSVACVGMSLETYEMRVMVGTTFNTKCILRKCKHFLQSSTVVIVIFTFSERHPYYLGEEKERAFNSRETLSKREKTLPSEKALII